MTLQTLFHSPETWCQGELTNSKGAYCLMGALRLCYYPDELPDLYAKIHHTIQMRSISLWNDAPERTFEDIQTLVKNLNL